MQKLRDQIQPLLTALYAADPKELAVEVIASILVLFGLSIFLSILIGLTNRRIIEKVFDHARQFCLNSAIALLAVITASFVLVQQQALQAHNQTLERLRLIDSTLAFKLDTVLSGVSRLYFTQAVLVGLNALPQAGTQANDLTQLRNLSAMLNTAWSADRAPPIVPADIPGLIDAFSLRSTANSPFLYSYLSPRTAHEIAAEERHLVTGMAALTGDLTMIDAPEIWASLDASNFNPARMTADKVRQRNRLSRNIESMKFPAVKFAWLICEYKEAVARDLGNQNAPIFGNTQYVIDSNSSDHHPSDFLEKNQHRVTNNNDGCSDRILRSIMMSYNSIIASSRMYDFIDDIYDLREREKDIKRSVGVPNSQ